MDSTLNQETVESPPQDAATVILVRDAGSDLEVLLLQRGRSRTVMNNAWVFPGGKLDSADFTAAGATVESLQKKPQSMLGEPQLDIAHASALFHAACRETAEETGVVISAGQLHPWSRWITPKIPSMMKKRFDARFFIARMPADQVAVHDGQEATDSAWYTARDALNAYRTNEITLAPPQIMTLVALARHKNSDSCINHAKTHTPYCIEPGVITGSSNERTMIYPGDAEHPIREKHMPGPTRLVWQHDHFEPATGFNSFFED